MIFQIKPKIVELVESANLLKMWVTFLIPRIEDGNNFGVSVQVRRELHFGVTLGKLLLKTTECRRDGGEKAVKEEMIFL